jgi:cobalt-zinc-cadmium efflux system outer membrane protein
VQLASFTAGPSVQLAKLPQENRPPTSGSSLTIHQASATEPLPSAPAPIAVPAPPPLLKPFSESVGSPVRPITLTDALTIALSRNPDLLVNRQELAIAGSQQAIANTYPLNPVFEAQIQSADNQREGTQQHMRQSYSILQEFETGGKGTYRRGAAAAGLDRAQWDLRQHELEVRSSVYAKFAALLNAARKLELAHETATLNSQFADNSRALLNAGKATGGDTLLAQEEAADSRQAEIAAETERSAAEIELRNLLGLADPGELRPEGEVTLPEDRGPIDLEAISAGASDNQPQVRAKAAALAQAEAAVALAHANQRADITAGPAVEYDENKTFFAGATIQVPLQIFNRKQGELMQAEAEREKAAADLEQTRLKVKLAIRSAWEQYEAARKTADLLAGATLPASQRHLQDGQRLLDVGQMDLFKLIELRRRNVTIRQQLLDAQYQMTVHRIEFETLSGRILPAEGDFRPPAYEPPPPYSPPSQP